MATQEVMAGQESALQPTKKIIETAQIGAEKAPAPPNEAVAADKTNGASRQPALETLKPGTRVKGTVRSMTEFGAFIDIGVGRDGLAHISNLKRAGIDQTLKVGDVIEVLVRRIDTDNNRISLTIPVAEDAKETKIPLRDLEVNSLVTGRVVRLADFGAFVDIGAQVEGLLHVSQLPWGYVNKPSEVLKVGDEVQVRILEIDPRKRRIALSMKDVEPVTTQVQPNNTKDEPQERIPTAFEVAFEKARQQSRRRSRA